MPTYELTYFDTRKSQGGRGEPIRLMMGLAEGVECKFVPVNGPSQGTEG